MEVKLELRPGWSKIFGPIWKNIDGDYDQKIVIEILLIQHDFQIIKQIHKINYALN